MAEQSIGQVYKGLLTEEPKNRLEGLWLAVLFTGLLVRVGTEAGTLWLLRRLGARIEKRPWE